jgi:hypothetical protein
LYRVRFAGLELELVLPIIVSQADVTLASDPAADFQLGVTMQPESDIELPVEQR